MTNKLSNGGDAKNGLFTVQKMQCKAPFMREINLKENVKEKP